MVIVQFQMRLGKLLFTIVQISSSVSPGCSNTRSSPLLEVLNIYNTVIDLIYLISLYFSAFVFGLHSRLVGLGLILVRGFYFGFSSLHNNELRCPNRDYWVTSFFTEFTPADREHELNEFVRKMCGKLHSIMKLGF